MSMIEKIFGKKQSQEQETPKENRPSVEQLNETLFALANHLHEQGMLEQAFNQMKLVATEGEYAPAMFNLGMYYWKGVGTEANIDEALKWLKKAAEKGDDKAAYNVAIAYHDGKVVARNFAEAKHWYEVSAELGNERAAAELEFFKEGLNVEYVLWGKDTFSNEDYEVKSFRKLKDAEKALTEHMDAAGRHSPDTEKFANPWMDLREYYWLQRKVLF